LHDFATAKGNKSPLVQAAPTGTDVTPEILDSVTKNMSQR